LFAVFETIFEFFINRPVFLLAVMALPLLIAARYLKLFPSKLLLLFAILPAALSLTLSVVSPDEEIFQLLLAGVIGIDVLLILLATFDAWMTVGRSHFSATRTLMGTGSQGKKYDVKLRLSNASKKSFLLTARDDTPPGFTATPEEFSTTVSGVSNTQFKYSYVCNKRGRADFECVYLRVNSPLGLWHGHYQIPVKSQVNIYPDIQQITEYDLLARTNRLSLLGMRRSRKIGQDNEFERLRDYTQDDNFRHIDWRSTARRQKLTVRDFQANQSQQIIFMLDCGRMMTGTHVSPDGEEVSMIDHSINAMLMLSYVALRQGDSVGLITFSNRVHNFTPAKSGVKHINRLLHATFDQDATHVESRYDEAFLYLRKNCPKRSLVVMISNVLDDINAMQIKQYMSVLTGRHLPLAVLLRDQAIFSALEEYERGVEHGDLAAGGGTSIYQAAAAAGVLNWRHQVIQDLKHQRVLTMDVFPDQLTAELVNQYLNIKARHLL
jgi:uncharacterized protein (DUF58 family)